MFVALSAIEAADCQGQDGNKTEFAAEFTVEFTVEFALRFG